MRKSVRSLVLVSSVSWLAAACGGGTAPPPASTPPSATPPPVVAGRSIDVAAMDRSVKPGTDFFLHANGAWYAKAEIPADRNGTGTFNRLSEENEKRTRAMLDEATRGNAPAGSPERKVVDYYASYLDEAAIEARGVEPLAKPLREIANLRDARSLARYFGGSLRSDVDALNMVDFQTDHVLGMWVEQDLNEPSRYVPYLMQGGLGMPDRSYYLDDSPRMQSLRTAYQRYLTNLLRLAGVADPEGKAKRAFAFEKKMAEVHAGRADSGDVAKSNNPWKRADFAKKAPGLDWDAFFSAASLERQESFVVWHPTAVVGLATLAKKEPLAVWKDYLTVRAVASMARYLPKAFMEEHYAFHEKELRGMQAMPPRWRIAGEVTNEAIGQAVGKMYVERYFQADRKRTVETMVANLLAAFGRRIDALTWMAPATKAKAKEKLSTMKVEVGYPNVWRDYSALEVVRGDVFGNAERAQLFEYRRNLAKLGKPVDRGDWPMLPHIVNAINLPVQNAIHFPAGTLQSPFFDPDATSAANYAGIGSTIGHEISHSFDDQGAKFDAKGTFKDWWTAEDFAHFEASGAALVAQYDAYRPLPDKAVNGKLTLSENIADLAGIAVAYDAWRASLAGQEPPVVDGLTGDQQFFLGFAQVWQGKTREAALRGRLETDGHAPGYYRAFIVRNLDAWYKAFDVAPAEPLFLAPNARVRVW